MPKCLCGPTEFDHFFFFFEFAGYFVLRKKWFHRGVAGSDTDRAWESKWRQLNEKV